MQSNNKMLNNLLCPFPIFEYETKVEYEEVENPSGISYILLELIDKMFSSKEQLGAILLKFGIPKDLHYIFANELAKLISLDIVYSEYDIDLGDVKIFEQSEINAFSLSQKGKQLFLDKAIPTGKNGIKTQNIYYNPVTDDLRLQKPQQMLELHMSCLGEDFAQSLVVDIKSQMFDFVKADKQSKAIGLKEKEKIVNVYHNAVNIKLINSKIKANICDNRINFVFDSRDNQAYFEQNYNVDVAVDILIDNGYIWQGEECLSKLNSDCGMGSLNILRPKDIDKVAMSKCKVFLSDNNKYCSHSDVLRVNMDIANCLQNQYMAHYSFASLDNDNIKVYYPARLTLDCVNFGDKIDIDILAEYEDSKDIFKSVVKQLYDNYASLDFCKDNWKIVEYCVKTLKDNSLYDYYLHTQLNQNNIIGEKIKLILKIYDMVKGNVEAVTYCNQYMRQLYEQYINDITKENFESRYDLLSDLAKVINIDNYKLAADIIQVCLAYDKDNTVFDILQNKIDVKYLLPKINVIPEYTQGVLDNININCNNALADKYNNLKNNLWSLCSTLGVQRYDDYAIHSYFDHKDFLVKYASYKSILTDIEQYRSYAKNEYEILNKYTLIFESIRNNINIEQNAAKNPTAITKKIIQSKIDQAKNQEALINLVIKSEFDLSRLLKADNLSEFELIDKAFDKKIITEEQKECLHNLRLCRNSYTHYSAKGVHFGVQDLTKWCDVVFEIGEKTNESKSNS